MILAIVSSLIFAMSLCADCFAVSLCSSVTLKKIEWKSVAFISLVFGVVQAAFLLLGYGFGDLFVGYVEKIAHWIGFLLLLYVGGGMVKESLEKACERRDLNGLKNIVIASIATSIDALAVGISLSMSHDSLDDVMLKGVAVLLVTILSVVIGIFCGHKIGHKLGKVAEFIGGCVLLLIGLNILFDFV